jgi:hypothetical protein
MTPHLYVCLCCRCFGFCSIRHLSVIPRCLLVARYSEVVRRTQQREKQKGTAGLVEPPVGAR